MAKAQKKTTKKAAKKAPAKRRTTKRKTTAKKTVKKTTKKAVRKPLQPQIPKKIALTWQGALRLVNDRVVKLNTPRGHGTGFHIGNFGTNDNLCAIATAYHVVDGVHEWGEPIKVVHEATGEEILLKEKDRAVFTYPKKDLAVMLFVKPKKFNLPKTQIELIPSGSYLVPGVDVAWCGYPGLMSGQLCFFHGFISCHISGDYLIDGVAINGVSGGPVFYIDANSNRPKIAGVITAYIPNRRSSGDSLPGVSMITSIAPCEDTIKSLRSLGEAKKEAAEQKKDEDKTKDTKGE
ncbi:MAG: serine protease [Candidatus Pacebacteria bacterium]|nr:serine protease [Candidatus Paceibacterota bacterium]